ncbi:benzoate-CoA ligase family protein [Ferviditalea candida]|uniref:Benzoate-CoA ligase family protein n=1 Tax=Ferviditalea candida TaxID=3108399 RepID=A0ABU5ZCE0_9BACL|nr:benzoate-CoA ligase family protein [Paenibacillaceae bacterium T2]
MELRGIGSLYNAAATFIDKNVNNGIGDKVAIHYLNEKITFKQLQDQVNRVGNALRQLGVEMESRVLLACYDSPEFIASFFGAIKIGAIPIPVNTTMTPSDFEYFLNNSRAKVVITNEDLWNKINHLRERFVFLKHVIVIFENANNIPGLISYREWTGNASAQLETAITNHNDAAFWLYSSGSTGNPKGVIHLQRDMEAAYNAYAKKVLKISENDITFSASKLFFAYGMGNGMYFPLGAGASTVLVPDRCTPELVMETIEKYRPTIFFGVPTLYGALIDLAERTGNPYDLSSLRICVSAGESLPAPYSEKWRKLFGVDILDGIGSTEALHIFISNRIGDIREGSTGKVVPGYEAKIVNEMGVALPPNETGDLIIKGDSIAHGYWNLHEENKRKFIGEWLQTGDKYYMDDDGYFWYCGRSDDMMKVGGIWVSPIEIENALIKHEVVLEAAVVGVMTENNLMTPKAYVVLKENVIASDGLKRELQAFLKQELAPYKYPRLIEFLDELPKTTTGKIQRFRLRA